MFVNCNEWVALRWVALRRSAAVLVWTAGLATGSAAMAEVIQLDISSGFNTDNWAGYREYQEITTVGGTDLGQAQGGSKAAGFGQGSFDVNNFHMIGAIDEATATAIGTGVKNSPQGDQFNGYAYSGAWFEPGFKTDAQATPLNGVITSPTDGRVYHIASHAGNATLPGDWLEAADVSFTGSGANVTEHMAMKFNAMSIYASHGEGQIVGPTTATLSIGQHGRYSDINFVLAAWDGADGARNARIVAIYDDASEQILYAFSTADERVGPTMEDGAPGVFDSAVFTAVDTFTEGYNVASGATGGVSGHAGTLWEFTAPLALDSTKVLVGIRLEDVNPPLKYQERGLSIYGASATLVPEPASLALLGLGAVTMLARRRTR